MAAREAGVWLLTRRLNWNGADRPVLAILCEVATTAAIRLWAEGALYESKDELRARGSRWMPKDRLVVDRRPSRTAQ